MDYIMNILNEMVLDEGVSKISFQTAIDKKYFGPVYHGTTKEKRDQIDVDGFKIYKGDISGQGSISNGYDIRDYFGGIPAPIHHLGFGVYFTKSMSIAKKYNHNTSSGLKPYYISADRLEIINFASPRTMMAWWIKNGYNYDSHNKEHVFGNPSTNYREIIKERYRATLHMTEYLKSKYDAVWFKGKTMYSVLDGDQLCVYDPKNIFQIDKSLIKPMEIGSYVTAAINIDQYSNGQNIIPMGTRGLIMHTRPAPPGATWAMGSDIIYDVKFDMGGRVPNVTKQSIVPYIK
jgi:hypothetical protein